MAGLAEWGSRASTPPLYKEGEGESSHIPSVSILLHLCFFLPPAMEKGNPGPTTVAARVAARQRVPPSQDPAAAEPATRGRGRGVAEVVVALGEEGDEAVQWPCLRHRCSSRWRTTSGTSPASSSSGCVGHRIAASISLLHLLRRWSSIHPDPLVAHEGLRERRHAGRRRLPRSSRHVPPSWMEDVRSHP